MVQYLSSTASAVLEFFATGLKFRDAHRGRRFGFGRLLPVDKSWYNVTQAGFKIASQGCIWHNAGLDRIEVVRLYPIKDIANLGAQITNPGTVMLDKGAAHRCSRPSISKCRRPS